MSEMIRKQIYMTRRIDRLVKEQAERLGYSQAEVIRKALEKVFDVKDEGPELEAWRELKRFLEERSNLKTEPHGRCWKREDLYEDRLEKQRNV